MKPTWLVLTLLALLFSVFAPSAAQEPQKELEVLHGTVLPEGTALENLGLSKDQREAINRIEKQYQGRVSLYRQQLMVRRLELQSLFRDPNFRPDAIRTKAKELGEIRDALQKQMIEYQIAVRSLLTSEQMIRWCNMAAWHNFTTGMER